MIRFYRQTQSILLLLMASFPIATLALEYSCPDPETVRERKISQDFEWTVAEDVSLHSILNVQRLYSVSLERHGGFMSCTYESESLLIRLDAKSIRNGCIFVTGSGDWFSSEAGQFVCFDEEKLECKVSLQCQIEK